MNALNHEAAFARVQKWMGHTNISTKRLYGRKKPKLEDSPTFLVPQGIPKAKGADLVLL